MRKHAQDIFLAAVNSVNAEQCVSRHLRRTGNRLKAGGTEFDLKAFDSVYVIGAGKATAHMAAAVESILEDRITSGLITVKYNHTRPLKKIRTIEAGHPVPDENGARGAAKILELAEAAGGDDLVICLLSGGGSALMPIASPGLGLPEKQETIRQLLACGADIREINAIRKHLSAIKGGRLALAAAPAVIITLIISDVVGDELDVIASGPTVADSSTFGMCLEIVKRYDLSASLPPAVKYHIEKGASKKTNETPKSGDLAEDRIFNIIAGNNFSALLAAAACSDALGYNTMILSSKIEGDTTQAAGFHCAVAKQVAETGHPVSTPACIISGGETTVRIRGKGKGGRSQEFCLAAAESIAGVENIVILCAGTDGTDGPTDAAGAVADHDTVSRAAELGLDASAFLLENDSYNFFKKTGDLVITGPTGTNVMDVRIMLVK